MNNIVYYSTIPNDLLRAFFRDGFLMRCSCNSGLSFTVLHPSDSFIYTSYSRDGKSWHKLLRHKLTFKHFVPCDTGSPSGLQEPPSLLLLLLLSIWTERSLSILCLGRKISVINIYDPPVRSTGTQEHQMKQRNDKWNDPTVD